MHIGNLYLIPTLKQQIEPTEQRIEENEKKGRAYRRPQDVPPQVLSQQKLEYDS